MPFQIVDFHLCRSPIHLYLCPNTSGERGYGVTPHVLWGCFDGNLSEKKGQPEDRRKVLYRLKLPALMPSGSLSQVVLIFCGSQFPNFQRERGRPKPDVEPRLRCSPAQPSLAGGRLKNWIELV